MSEDPSRDRWQERSEDWAARSVPGRSQDDTFNQMIIAEAGIRPGESVLDLGSGTGNPAVSIALAMDGRGSVTCGDFTFRMLETARTRAKNLGLSLMRFVCCDMQALPFPDAAFDCVTSRFALMSVENKTAAAGEARRVLRPGGRVAYVVWGPYGENPPFRIPCRAAAETLGEDEGPVPPRHSMGAPGMLKEVLDAAGFVHTEERELRYDRRVEDIDDYVAGGLRRALGKRIDELPAERVAAVREAILDAWNPYRADDILWVPNYARLGIGWKAE